MDITVRLKDDEKSLAELLAGPLVSRFWLAEVEGEPGVYTLHAGTYADDARPGAESAHALLHYLSSFMEKGPPPLPELTLAAKVQRGRWQQLLESLPSHETPEEDGS